MVAMSVESNVFLTWPRAWVHGPALLECYSGPSLPSMKEQKFSTKGRIERNGSCIQGILVSCPVSTVMSHTKLVRGLEPLLLSY